ncbi:BatA domain-containing protein [Pontibacter beigongshangensis]|uniref:BatA domain-containing protein n=1 Tax=Pontibacter beigongshangensis TaxID=2574733 RepID=UPI001F5104AC|nr:BatA domain-containing protein [Pontibacter beigongshangensis]
MALLYPTFLFALAATAIPVILHLAQLRKARRVEFSNVRLIKTSKDITASQRNLKEILILLCRVFFIVFLVLAFAQPFLPASDSYVPADTSQVSVVIDNSFSMQNTHAEEDVPMLTAATEQAQSTLDLFPASTTFRLFTAANTPHSGVLDNKDASSLLSNLNYAASSGLQLLPSERTAEHVFIFSDFQRSTFQPASLSTIDSTKQVHLVPIKAASIANVVIDSIYLEDEFIRPAGENLLHIQLYNAGEEAIEDCPVKLIVNERQVAALSVDLPARQVTETTVSFSVLGSGINKAYVLIEDYPVEFDNSFHFVMAPSSNIEVVEITDNSSDLLPRLFKNEAFFRLTQYQQSNIDYARTAAAHIVVVHAVKNISSALSSTLATFVKGGGTVVIIPPVQADNTSYSSLMQNLNIAASLIASTAGEPAKTALAAPDPANPFFKSIFSDFDPKMQMPGAARTLAWSRASDDILRFRGGSPFLSRFDRGNGQVFLMAAPLDDSYNELQNHALFVPVMYKLAIASYKQEQQLSYALDGATVSLPVPAPRRQEGIFKLTQDSLEFIPEQHMRGGNLFFTIPDAMHQAGFYDLRLGDSTITTLAFHYPEEESLLEQYSPDELRSFLKPGQGNVHIYDYADAFSVKGEFEKRYFGVKLWKYCLILCLIFLMAEIALIRFF